MRQYATRQNRPGTFPTFLGVGLLPPNAGSANHTPFALQGAIHRVQPYTSFVDATQAVYEITASIGEGGMGQVYRATDTTLGRQVAIKLLPDRFASDPERMARFEREAKTLASLNHPNIAAIYGFEKSAGVHALVMELVDGDDLSQHCARRDPDR